MYFSVQIEHIAEKIWHEVTRSRRQGYLLPIKSKIRDMRFVIVPIGRNHSPKIQIIIRAVRAHAKPNTKQARTTNAASPYPTKINFIKVERGSIPTALTRFDHGPNWSAYSPLFGVT